MECKSKRNIQIFIVFFIMSFLLILLFLPVKDNYPFFTIERAIYSTAAYFPFALIGIVYLVKPDLPIKAFMTHKKEIKKKDYWGHRILGVLWILFSIDRIFDAWNGII